MKKKRPYIKPRHREVPFETDTHLSAVSPSYNTTIDGTTDENGNPITIGTDPDPDPDDWGGVKGDNGLWSDMW